MNIVVKKYAIMKLDSTPMLTDLHLNTNNNYGNSFGFSIDKMTGFSSILRKITYDELYYSCPPNDFGKYAEFDTEYEAMKAIEFSKIAYDTNIYDYTIVPVIRYLTDIREIRRLKTKLILGEYNNGNLHY